MKTLTRFSTLLLILLLLTQSFALAYPEGEGDDVDDAEPNGTYSDAVVWAAKHGIVASVNEHRASPHASTTPENTESSDDYDAHAIEQNMSIPLISVLSFFAENGHGNGRSNGTVHSPFQRASALALQLRAESPPPRRVAFTFDDGPGPHTMRLLDALAERDIQVTFFVLGQQVRRYPEIAARMVADGHEIAFHGYDHRSFTRLTPAQMIDQIERSRAIIYEATGVEPTLFRPPYGAQNAAVRAVSAELGLPINLWSVDTRDWERRNVTAIMSHFISKKGEILIEDGDNVLMHDVHGTTVDAAIIAIDLLRNEGFAFLTASELLIERHGELTPGQVYRN